MCGITENSTSKTDPGVTNHMSISLICIVGEQIGDFSLVINSRKKTPQPQRNFHAVIKYFSTYDNEKIIFLIACISYGELPIWSLRLRDN